MKKAPVELLIVTNGNGEKNTVLDFFLHFCIKMKKQPVAVLIAKRRIEWNKEKIVSLQRENSYFQQ